MMRVQETPFSARRETATMDKTMGTVKWFSRVRGYGFIQPDDGTEDVFVHFSAIEGDGYRNLYENERVRFLIEDTPKGPQAVAVSRIVEEIEEETEEAPAPLAEEAVAPAVEEVIGPLAEEAIAPAVEEAIGPAVEEAIGPAVEEAIEPEDSWLDVGPMEEPEDLAEALETVDFGDME
jgi:CspA family cold shock protein